jgi:ribose transport system ATP-binding protein
LAVKLEVKGISKSFPGVKALDNVSLTVHKGEVHGLVGENGAGKSTLMHILAGVYQQDEGELFIDGNKCEFRDERSAQDAGIGMVFQERSLVKELSVAENILVGRQPIKCLNFIDKKQMCSTALTFLKRVNLDIDPMTRVAQLSPIQQQLVEIAKALSLNAQMLILDEPTATITEREIGTLFTLVKQLKKEGIAIIYISHRLQELHFICDRVSVLKDGVYQGMRVMNEAPLEEIVTMMVGRNVLSMYDDRNWKGGEVVLEVKNLSSSRFKDISFSLKKQEILGIAGLAGSGRTELALALFGVDRKAKGDVYVNNKRTRFTTPKEAINAGLGYLPEDRKDSGVFLDLDITSNIVSANSLQFTRYGLFSEKKAIKSVRKYIRDLKITTPSSKQKVINLSGGNQQKVLMARWLMKDPDILIIDEPTRGIDVGAKEEIYKLIRRMAVRGKSIIIISSELPEIITLCDRVIVMCLGRKTGELLHEEATEEKIMRLASGLSV